MSFFAEVKQRYIRWPSEDRRFARGDDWAGDAWLDMHTGKIVWSAVGWDRNEGEFYDFGATTDDPLK